MMIMSAATAKDFGRQAITQALQTRGYDLATCNMICRTIPDDDAPDFGLFEDRLQKTLIFAAKHHNAEIDRLEAEADQLEAEAMGIRDRIERLRKAVTEV
jgi:uncharacterized coiled-coil DUF342 family protein